MVYSVNNRIHIPCNVINLLEGQRTTLKTKTKKLFSVIKTHNSLKRCLSLNISRKRFLKTVKCTLTPQPWSLIWSWLDPCSEWLGIYVGTHPGIVEWLTLSNHHFLSRSVAFFSPPITIDYFNKLWNWIHS